MLVSKGDCRDISSIEKLPNISFKEDTHSTALHLDLANWSLRNKGESKGLTKMVQG